MRRLAHQLTNRLMHQPTLALRGAAADERQDLLEAAVELLLGEPESRN